MNGDFVSVPQAVRAGLIIGTAPLGTGCGLELRGGFLQVDLSQPWMRQWASQPVVGQAVVESLKARAERIEKSLGIATR